MTQGENLEELGHVIVTLRFGREGKDWVGTCLELGTSTFARTLEKAQAELHELVTLHLSALDDEGELEQFFKDQGIKIHWGHLEEDRLTLPVPFGDWEDNSPFYYQPHVFPVREPDESLATTGA